MKNKAKELTARVKETVQSAQKQIKEFEGELNVKGKANEFGTLVKETVQSAQKQFSGLEEDVQKFVNRMQERLGNTPAEGMKKVDDLMRTVVISDFVEKMRTIERFTQGAAVRKDILERFGLVPADEVADLKAELSALKARVTKLANRPAGVSKSTFSTLKKRVDVLEKGGEKKKAPARKKASK